MSQQGTDVVVPFPLSKIKLSEKQKKKRLSGVPQNIYGVYSALKRLSPEHALMFECVIARIRTPEEFHFLWLTLIRCIIADDELGVIQEITSERNRVWELLSMIYYSRLTWRSYNRYCTRTACVQSPELAIVRCALEASLNEHTYSKCEVKAAAERFVVTATERFHKRGGNTEEYIRWLYVSMAFGHDKQFRRNPTTCDGLVYVVSSRS